MTTKTVKASGPGQDYPTLTAWVASLALVLSAPQQADVYNFGPSGLVESGGVAITGFTTTATNKIIINVPVGERHNGTAHSGAYVTNIVAGASTTTMRLGTNVDHVEYHWLEIESLDTAGGAAFHWNTSCGASNLFVMTHCIIHGSTASGVIGATAANGIYQYRNNICYSRGAQRVFDARGVVSVEISNCIFWSASADFTVINDTESTVKNSYAGGGTTASWCKFFTSTGSYNASDDNSATDRWPTGSIASIAGSTAFTSVTAGSEDFRTKSGFTTFTNAGTTIAAVTDDIIGTARPQGAAYDIGVFENVAVGITATAAISDPNDTVASAGGMVGTGTAAITDPNDTVAAAGSLVIGGAAAISDPNDTVAAAGNLVIGGAAAISDPNDTVSAFGGFSVISGSAAITDPNDVITAVGSLIISGTAAINDPNDTMSAFGGSGVISGAAAIVDPNDTVASTGTISSAPASLVPNPRRFIVA